MLSNNSQSSHSMITPSFNQPVRTKPKQRHLTIENDKPSSSSLPPALVIRAISDYEAQEDTEFSFENGDFFHVIDVLTDNNGCAWFKVENPAKSMMQRLVPATHFQKYGPTRPLNLVPIHKLPDTPPAESQSHKVFPKFKAIPIISTPLLPQNLPITPPPYDARTRISNLSSRSLFGIIKYSFVAERADELTAQSGEPVVIVAHSAQDWLVAKPICRLGAPGLIPTSYLAIQEIQTGQVLSPEQVAHLMQTSAIPTVEQWKKIVADHKARCISLGVVTHDQGSENPWTHPAHFHHEEESDSTFPAGQNLLSTDWQQSPASFIQSAHNDSRLSRVEEADENDAETTDRIGNGRLLKAHVISFHFEQGQFWYQVQALFRKSNGVQRSKTMLLYRLDTHFRELESALHNQFKSQTHALPQLPHSAPATNELDCALRMEQLNTFLERVCALPELVCMSEAVFEFLSSRPGDMELDSFVPEKETTSRNSKEKLHPPTLQLPLEPNELSTKTGMIDRSSRNSQKTAKSYLSDDLQSWISSWQATTADECRFFNGAPSPSTRPSSFNASSPTPSAENNELPGSNPKVSPPPSLWPPNFDQSLGEESTLGA